MCKKKWKLSLSDDSCISLICNKKSSGPRTEPWGTPQVESNLSETWGPIWVVWVRPCK